MTNSKPTAMRRLALGTLCAALAIAPLADAHAHYYSHPPAASEASALSLLPVAVSVVGPAMILSAGAALTVVAVEASATGTVYVLERASDGVRASVHIAGHAALGVGTRLACTAIGAGWVLSAAGQAIAFVPNQLGAALLYNEPISRGR